MESIEFNKKIVPPIVLDYLRNDPALQHLYELYPSLDNVEKAISARSGFRGLDRNVLSENLEAEYSGGHPSVVANIQALRQNNTYTVTTGHQLNLATGPMYFIYKILTVIRISEDLNRKYKQFHFVPIYWMATEDHDFEEINHFWFENEKITWNSDQKGMVGDFGMDDLSWLDEIERRIDNCKACQEFIQLLRDCYTDKTLLTGATRKLVYRLFEKYGLVVVDANNSTFKKAFVPYFQMEMERQITNKSVFKTLQNYPYRQKVNPRDLNIFYTEENLRSRITRSGEDEYSVLNTDLIFSGEEINELLESNPERFSPNVLLRPVYQEVVLPNVMYVGGGSEVAYWLQLRESFKRFSIPFPLVKLRSSVLILRNQSRMKIQSSQFELTDVFRDDETILSEMLKEEEVEDLGLPELERIIREDFRVIKEKIKSIENSLVPSAGAAEAQMIRKLLVLNKKVKKARKGKIKNRLEVLNRLRKEAFPGGTFQERKLNLLEAFKMLGENPIPIIYGELNPWEEGLQIHEIVKKQPA